MSRHATSHEGLEQSYAAPQAENFGEEFFAEEDFEDESLDEEDDFDDGEIYGDLVESTAYAESDDELYENVDEALYETLLEEAAILSAMPEELKAFPEWREAYAGGVTYADAVRTALGPEFATLTDEEADDFVQDAIADMSPEEIEGFFKSLGRIASKALPAIGGAIGTFIAPGVGTAIGGALGGLAGKALGSATRGRRRPRTRTRSRRQVVQRRTRPRRTRSRRRSRARRGGSTRMRAELMRLLQNPQLLQALTGSLLGGRGAVRTGDSLREVNLGAFLNALEHYAQEAAEEAHAEMVDETAPSEASDGEGFMDAGARAETLMDILDEATVY